jgi:hypothetical protein
MWCVERQAAQPAAPTRTQSTHAIRSPPSTHTGSSPPAWGGLRGLLWTSINSQPAPFSSTTMASTSTSTRPPRGSHHGGGGGGGGSTSTSTSTSKGIATASSEADLYGACRPVGDFQKLGQIGEVILWMCSSAVRNHPTDRSIDRWPYHLSHTFNIHPPQTHTHNNRARTARCTAGWTRRRAGRWR